MGQGRGTSSRQAAGVAFVLLLIAIVLVPAGVAQGKSPAPGASEQFFGVVTRWQSIDDPAVVERMRHSGVGSIRFLALWSRIERVHDHYEWSFLDRRLLAVRQAGARPLPFLYGFPRWLLNSFGAPLRHAEGQAEWQQFLRDLVARYGPGGVLDRSRPRYAPVRRWQIWNEPNLSETLGMEQAKPVDYVDVLRISAEAIHSVDPAAKLIAAGLAPAIHGFAAADFIEGVFDVYARRGIEPDFSQVSVHPYGSTPATSIRRLRAFSRAVRGAAANSTYPILVGEIGWASRGGTKGFLGGTARSQARRLRRVYRRVLRLRERLDISSMHWYAWENGTPGLGCSFCSYTGLLRADGTAKPAWRSFRRLATR